MTAPQDHQLEQWMARSRSAEAARSRRRTAAWHQYGPADADLVGLLADLANRGTEVIISLINGHDHRGRFLEVAHTWAIVEKHSGDLVLLRLRCVASVATTERRLPFGARSAPSSIGFAATLDRIAFETIVTLWCGVALICGELQVVGDELAVVCNATTRRYVSIETIDVVAVAVRTGFTAGS